MAVGSKRGRWLVAAAVLAVALPLLVVAGFGLTLAACLAVETMRSGTVRMGTSLAPWWAAGFVATCVALWFLVRWCVRFGGWRALLLGLGTVMLVAAAAVGLGSLQQRLDPTHSMAGLGLDTLGVGLGVFALGALMMGAVALGIDSALGAIGRRSKTGP